MQQHRTIVVADHHKSVFVCQALDRETGEVRKLTLDARRTALEPFLASLAGPTHVFVEACRSWEWVSDLCEDLSIDLDLVDASRMPEIAKSTKKTDANDVQAMVNRLTVTGQLPQSYRASRPERELRGLTRHLSVLRKDKRKLVHRIHAAIDAHGLPASKASFDKPAWREAMKAGLSSGAWLVLESLLSQYDITSGWMAILERTLADQLRGNEGYQRLQEIPGTGPVIAATIRSESAGIERFKSARKHASFAGFVPTVRCSAGMGKYGHITRTGPRDLRWALGQATMLSLQCKQETAAAKMHKRKRKKGKHARVAICAGAHKLARIGYVVLTRKENFRATPPRGKQAA
jgi:transposase